MSAADSRKSSVLFSGIWVSEGCWIIHSRGRSHSFLLYPRVQGPSREVLASETETDPLLAVELETVGSSACGKHLHSVLRLVNLVGFTRCHSDKPCFQSFGYFNGCWKQFSLCLYGLVFYLTGFNKPLQWTQRHKVQWQTKMSCNLKLLYILTKHGFRPLYRWLHSSFWWCILMLL